MFCVQLDFLLAFSFFLGFVQECFSNFRLIMAYLAVWGGGGGLLNFVLIFAGFNILIDPWCVGKRLASFKRLV